MMYRGVESCTQVMLGILASNQQDQTVPESVSAKMVLLSQSIKGGAGGQGAKRSGDFVKGFKKVDWEVSL